MVSSLKRGSETEQLELQVKSCEIAGGFEPGKEREGSALASDLGARKLL